MIKYKLNKFKRVGALFGVVLVVAMLAMPFASSALSITDIPFYNFFNAGFLSATYNNGTQAYIVDSSTDGGYIDIQFVTSSNITSYYVPSSYVNTPLRSFAPSMVEGNTYYMNCEYTVSDDRFINASYITLRNPTTGLETRIYYGQPFTVTAEMLDSYPTFYAGLRKTGVTLTDGDTVDVRLKLWCNTTPDQPFASYNLAKELFDSAYLQGKADGIAEYTRLVEIFSKEYISSVRFNWGYTSGFSPGYTIYNPNEIEFYGNGYSFATDDFPSYYYSPPTTINPTAYLDTFEVIYDLTNLDDTYIMGSTPFYLTVKGCDVWVEAVYGDYEGYKTYTLGGASGAKTVDISRELLLPQFNTPSQIHLHVNVWGNDKGSDLVYDPTFYAAVSIADVGGIDYVLGYDDGTQDGIAIGKEEGFVAGRQEGYSEGYNNGVDDGIEQGYTQGESAGFSNGLNAGYAQGKEDGYYDGVAAGQKENTFYTLIYSVIDAPLNVLSKTFSFDIMGVNMSTVMYSLFTFCILFICAKFMFKIFIP